MDKFLEQYKDKLDHYVFWSYGTLIMGLCLSKIMAMGDWVAALIMIFVGYIKEKHDESMGRTFDWNDILFDALGIATALLLIGVLR